MPSNPPKPLVILSGLDAVPDRLTLPGQTTVTFSIVLSDPGASAATTNNRTVTFTLDAGNDLSFENGGKSVSDIRPIARSPTNLNDLIHTINGTGNGKPGFNVSLFDETGQRLGQTLLHRG